MAALKRYGGFDYSYVEPDLPAIVKLHGSANFRASHQGLRIEGLTVTPEPGATQAALFDGPIEPIKFEAAVKEFSVGKPLSGPAMSLYMEGKNDYVGRSGLRIWRGQWRGIVKHAQKIVVVGANYNPEDPHIWDPILGSPAEIGIVDLHAEEMAAKMKSRHDRVQAIANGFDCDGIAAICKFIEP